MSKRIVPADDFFSHEITGASRFYLNLGPIERGRLAVSAGGWEACADDYYVARAGFPYFSIEFVVGGRGEVVLDGQSYPLVAGSVFSYGPGTAHTIVSDRRDCLRKFFVDFRGRAALKLMTTAGFPPGTCGAVGGATRVTSVFEELVKSGLDSHGGGSRGSALALELLLLVVAKERVEVNDAGSARATFDRCHARLCEGALQLRSVSALAASCHVDAAYLCRLYQRFLGQSPYRFLVRMQMGWVAERLLEPGGTLHQVAGRLEMDPFQLSRIFRRVYGISPRRFVQMRSRQEGRLRRPKQTAAI
jgi:AraC-like DNA-binding protein